VDVDARRRAEDSLVTSAANRLAEALRAWIEEDFDGAASSAPMALELLVKGALWKVHPTLLVLLDSKQERALVTLVTDPRLDHPQLRTSGLAAALGRLVALRGELPVPADRQKQLVACHNGGMHVGTLPRSGAHSAEVVAGEVLADTLVLCNYLLSDLGRESSVFYGDRHALVSSLLEARGSEIHSRVARKQAQAQARLDQWQRHVDNQELWEESARQLEVAAEAAFAPKDFGQDVEGIAQDCPVCGFSGRLLGRLDVDGEADVEYEDGGPVHYGYWVLSLHPQSFACNVCKLRLHGTEELRLGPLPAAARQVKETELSADFDASEFAHHLYGLCD
jgi:hypothetical protein